MAAGSKPIKVLFIRDHLARTGGTVYFRETLPQFDRSRIQPFLCALHPRCAAADEFEALGVPPIFVERAKRDPRRLADLMRFVRETEADLLHLSGPKSFLLGRLTARLSRRPAIVHFHSMLPETPGMAIVQRRFAACTALGLAVSEAVRHWAIREYALAPQRMQVLYNGHDVDRFASAKPNARAGVRQALAIAPDAALIGLIGRVLTAQKGQDLMIRLMPEVLTRRSDAVLLIVGEGPDLQDCEALAAGLGLGSAVRFLGHRRDVSEILAAVDVVAVPSLCEEAFSFVALEASAAGRPVVAFRSGGLPEIVRHEEAGIIVPKGDSACLADALLQVLSNRSLAERLGESGRRNASRFTLESHVQRLTEIYQAVLCRSALAGSRSRNAG